MGRGSIAQSALATLISFSFCALSFREQPFNKPRLNHVKIFTEVQIFGILLVCLIVQVHDQGFDSEFVTLDAYGVMQTALVIAIVPVVLYFLVITFRDLKTEVKDGMDELSHRHDDHRHVSKAEDHAVIVKPQDEKSHLREQPDENGPPKEQDQYTQHGDTNVMLKESLAKSQAENAKKDAELIKKDAELAKAQAENAKQRVQLAFQRKKERVQAEHGAENAKKDAELAAAWQRLTAQAQRLGALSPGRARSFSPGRGASA